MNEHAIKRMVNQCVKRPKLASKKGFLLIALDRACTGIGAGSAFAWMRADQTWKARLLEGISRSAVVGDAVELAEDEDLYGDGMEENWTEEAGDVTEAADYRIFYFDHGADVRFFAHVNRTGDGLNIKEDFVSVDQGSGPQELPIVYWNAGSTPVKADGRVIHPGYCYVLLPSDPARMERRKTECQLKQQLLEWYNSEVEQVEKEIMTLKPDCPEPLARRLAEQFYNHYASV